MKMIDAIGIALIVVGIALTVLTYLAAHQPIADVQSFTLHELQSPRSEFAPRGPGGNF